MSGSFKLPDSLRGRSLRCKVIPMVCNLRNMLEKLLEVNGDFTLLKQWEKRSYKAYNIEQIKGQILNSPKYEWKPILRRHILDIRPANLGASCLDIYLVAYVSQTFGPGRKAFFEYIRSKGISDKPNTAQAIWQVGKGDGVYLGVLNDDGTVRDWEFMSKWVNG